MINHTLLSFISALIFGCLFIYCSYPGFIVPDPPEKTIKAIQMQGEKPDSGLKENLDKDPVEEIDFADAFIDDYDTAIGNLNKKLVSSDYPPFQIKSDSVRVILLRNISRITLYSVSNLNIGNNKNYSVKGRIVFRSCGQKFNMISGTKSYDIMLPCTLKSTNKYNYIDLGEKSYRGDIILITEKKGFFSVINFLPVENYLRGVVPLEIGKRPETEIEALKAQAVAARTYTYKRIEERKNDSFDLTCTVSDQVYGGVHVEYRESDLAIKLTKNLIMVFNDSLVHAYYHSTCGGRTANIEEVWNKPRYSYLRSVRDTDSSGNAYCSISKYFTWKEKWSERDFNYIVSRYLKKNFPQKKIGNTISVFRIDSFFKDGRIKSCTLGGAGWTQKTGGDKIRFILRRNTSDKAILRSANFRINRSKGVIRLEGRGYGHGVGMCQMGAIGRARAGQDFEKILKSYYSGVSIHTASITKRKK